MMATNMPDSARPGAAAARAASTASTRSATRRRRAASAPTRATSPRSSTPSPTPRWTSWPRSRRTPRAPSIKDIVNESLIVAIRDGRDIITWADVLEAKQAQGARPVRGLEYIERERHAIAIHEACHAVMAYRVRKRPRDRPRHHRAGRGDVGGFVSSIPLEERFTEWRTELRDRHPRRRWPRWPASGCSSTATTRRASAATWQSATSSRHAHGGVLGHGPDHRLAPGHAGRSRARRSEDGTDRNVLETELGRQVEAQLQAALPSGRGRILDDNRRDVLAVAHALETHKTITGEDVEAIIEGRHGPARRRPPVRPAASSSPTLEAYHEVAAAAHVATVEHRRSRCPVMAPAAAVRRATGTTRVGAADARPGARRTAPATATGTGRERAGLARPTAGACSTCSASPRRCSTARRWSPR